MSTYGLEDAELLVSALARLTQTLNVSHRFAGFPLGGDGNIVGAGQIGLWQSGFPLRIAYRDDGPYHDSRQYSAPLLLEQKAVDAVVWLSLFDAKDVPPREARSVPTIVIARKDIALDFKPDVFFPVGVPGIDHGGVVVRADSVISLPLRKLRSSALPSACAVLDRLHAGLA